MNYEREKDGAQLDFHGMNLVLPPDRMPAGKYPFAQNVRRYKPGGVTGRAVQQDPAYSLPTSVHSLRRLNDLTPNGPVLGYVIIGGAGTNLYCNAIQVDSNLSGNPISLLPFRPNTSVQPWMYVSDSLKMDKVRSDGTCYKMGIKEPQNPPTITLVPASDVASLVGDVTVYYFNNPVAAHNPPLQAVYLWKNAADPVGGSTVVETAAQAAGFTTGNSLLFDDGLDVGGANPVAWTQYQTYIGTVNTAGTVVTWDSGDQFGGLTAGKAIVINGTTYTITGTPTNTSLNITVSAGNQTAANYSAAVASGTVPLFTPQLESEGYQDFHCDILATLYIPAAGSYTLSLSAKDDVIWGIGNSANGTATWNTPAGTASTMGQRMTTLKGYKLLPRTYEGDGGDGHVTTASVLVSFSAPGNYPFEIDWDYWYHKPRGLQIKVNGANIPPIPDTAITNSQYRYTYRSSATGAVSNPSPASAQAALSVFSSLVLAQFSTDPQVDKIDFYRLDAGLTNYTYVGTIPNSVESTTIVPSVTAATTPQTVQIGSATGLFAGESALVDVGGSQETVQILSISPTSSISTSITSAARAGGSGTADVQVTFLVASTVNFAVGNIVTISGVNTTVGPPGYFNGSFVIAAINPGVSITVGYYQAFFGAYTGTGGTMTNASASVPAITAVFTKNHSAGAAFVTFAAQLSDTLLDTDIADNPILEFDNFEPFPSIDLPRKGVVNVYGIDSGNSPGVVSWVSGDTFNVRWLPGTVIIIETVAYTLNTRPASQFALTASNVEIINGVEDVVTPPIGLGYNYEIAEPILAAQPLPFIWGPTDNVAFAFGCGDPLRPGTLYWCKGNNLDSAPDTNQEDITSPSEPLMNGCMVAGFGMVFSSERAWIIWPNYFNALATVNGTQGATWTFQETISTRGLYIATALTVDGFGNVYFRAKDGIYVSAGGHGAQSITDDIYNLFPHEGEVASPVTIAGHTVYPPDDSKPSKQHLSVATGYLYYDYVDVQGNPRTLTFDISAGGWIWDVYQYPVTVHALEEGPNANDVITGCQNGDVRRLGSQGSEIATAWVLMPSFDAGDTRAQKHFGDIYTEMQR